ncbi:MAG: hypothetical protein PHE89_01365 [Alphaproteobacteria bacterium]|nr:hypothetical protein [Alphaproteobacteria bacterium]
MFFLAFLVTACGSNSLKNEGSHIQTYANAVDVITLQELNTRALVNCYRSSYQSAETCAEIFEQKGYVRLKDIPHKPAKFDNLKQNTYPTRRWREGEGFSRW